MPSLHTVSHPAHLSPVSSLPPRLAEQGHLFGSRVPQKLAAHGVLGTPAVATIAEDASQDLAATGKCLADTFEINESTLEQRRKVRCVCARV